MTAAAAPRGGARTCREPRVLWVHNTARDGGMFLWDVLEAIPPTVKISEVVVPLRPTLRSLLQWIGRIRSAARSVDVVHAQFGSLVGLFAAFTSRPFILSLRGTDFYALPSEGLIPRIESRLRQLFTYIACLRADVIVVMSRRMRGGLRQWPFLRRKLIVVLTDPVGGEFIEEHLLPDRRNIKNHAPFRVFVGSLSASNPVKRTWIVEKSVELLSSIGVPMALEIVSGAPRLTVKEVMKKSDVIALVSTHEGWPNVIKEGQACGLPFVATDVSDLADFCAPGSLNRLVEPNELDVAMALVDVIAHKIFLTAQADLYPETVGIKHELLYNYICDSKIL